MKEDKKTWEDGATFYDAINDIVRVQDYHEKYGYERPSAIMFINGYRVTIKTEKIKIK